MGASLRFEHNPQGIGDLLRSAEVRAHMKERAERMAAAVKSETELPVFCEDHTGSRARFRVGIDDFQAKRLEAETRILGRAVDAAR